MKNQYHWQKTVNKIEFWILIFFLIRLIGIMNPPLEIGHNWRQVTGLMVARNYLEVDANITYPRVDDNIGETGIIGMEFPTMNYLYFIIAKIFGYAHWYGRLLNLIVSSIGLFFFSKIIVRFFDHRVALTSTILLAASICFAFSRKMMPDTFCISLMFIGLYYGIKYLDKQHTLYLLTYVLFSSLAILTKIPAGIYLIIVLMITLNSKSELRQKIYVGVASIIPLLLTYLWYFEWNPHLSNKFGNWYNSGKPLIIGFNEVILNIGKVLENFYFNSFSSYLIFSLFLIGLVMMFYKQNFKLIFSFGGLFIIFLVYIFKSGFYFYHHSYYIIPFVPAMALVAGYAVSNIKKNWLFVLALTLGLGESIANQQHDFFNKPSELYKMDLEAIADSISTKEDLIVINGGDNPQQLYLTHRKGWSCNNNQLLDTAFIKSTAKKGCKYVFIDNQSFASEINQNMVFNNEYYTVYKIDVAVLN